MVVAEAPGKEEHERGIPLIGKSGQLIRAELVHAGIDPFAIYYTNAVKCRPHENRTPTAQEIAAWLPALADEIIERQPIHLILLGRTAQQAWQGVAPILVSRQMDTPVPFVVVHQIPHPSAIMRDRKKMQPWLAAIGKIARAVNGEVEEEVVLLDPEPWEEGEPDYGARWLAADTEFKLLNDGGSDDALVCIQVSDGTRAGLARWDDIPQVRERLRNSHVYAHNIKADARNLGIDLDNLDSWDDTGLMAYVLRYPRVGLKIIGPELTGIPMSPISDILTVNDITEKRVKLTKRGLPAGSRNVTIEPDPDDPRFYLRKTAKARKINFEEALDLRYEDAKDYALRDPVVTSRLAAVLEPQLRASPRQWAYYRDFEKPIVPVLDRMERHGVMIDADALVPLEAKLADAITDHDERLRDILGVDGTFNRKSNAKLADALIGLGLPLVGQTKSGQISVDEASLLKALGVMKLEEIDEENLSDAQWALVHVLRAREYDKLQTTYVQRLLLDRDASGRIHASFNQMVADTDRFSSSGPNLQNIPVRGQIGSAIRRAFVAGPGSLLVKTDFSALEVRIFAHYTQDEAMRSAFEHGISPHDLNAERFKIDRKSVKNWYFAVIYGADALKAAMTAGVSVSDAQAMMRLVREESPALLSWPVHIQNLLTEFGYVETLFGWRNYYPHMLSPIKAESNAAIREAGNMPIQGTASGIVKKFMMAQDKLAREYDATIVLQVHDETVVEVPQKAAKEFAHKTVEIVRGLGEMGVGFSIPLDVEVGVGQSWGDLTSVYKEGKWRA
jgi:uracil-DNA glycosylase family 4